MPAVNKSHRFHMRMTKHQADNLKQLSRHAGVSETKLVSELLRIYGWMWVSFQKSSKRRGAK